MIASNFKAVYGNPTLRAQFFNFLRNVYHLYPEDKFHNLIQQTTEKMDSDSAIYQQIQKELADIKTLFSDLTYGLPALSQQKNLIATQTWELLGQVQTVNGYLEIGTKGRYTRTLQERLNISGRIYLLNQTPPSYSPSDIVERGGILQVGESLPLADYAPLTLADSSLELVTNYIGFHHAPLKKLDAFVASIARCLNKGGFLVLRDHQVDSDEMYALVALAHDVFNAGLNISWKDNAAEIRHFRPIEKIEGHLASYGLIRRIPPLLQFGDPTKNNLMIFEKTI
jgi:hypothetical protein